MCEGALKTAHHGFDVLIDPADGAPVRRIVDDGTTTRLLSLTAEALSRTSRIAPPLSEELRKRWAHFSEKFMQQTPAICPECQGEMCIHQLCP